LIVPGRAFIDASTGAMLFGNNCLSSFTTIVFHDQVLISFCFACTIEPCEIISNFANYIG
jgi:hypothetical protein